jgi:hypothetical protein
MATRVIRAVDRRLTLALQVAEAITPAELDQSDRVFQRGAGPVRGTTWWA